jgi:uncharacterized protein YceH (UPF0502 family)
MAQHILTASEPLFYGKGLSDKPEGLPAEEFEHRCTAATTSLNMTPAQAAAFTIGKLRGAAYTWFHQTLTLTAREEHDAAITDVDAFWALFRAAWFKVQSARDVSTDWASCVRRDGERPTEYLNRFFGEMSLLQTLLPNADASADVATALQTRVDELVTAVAAHHDVLNHNAITAAKAALTRQLAVFKEAVNAAQKLQDISQIALKFAAVGARHPKITELLRKEEREFQGLQQVTTKVRNAERDLPDSSWRRSSGHNAHKTASPVCEDDDSSNEAEDAEVDAIRNAKKGKKAKKGNGNDKARSAGGNGSSGGHNPNGGASKSVARPFVKWDRTKPPPPELGPCPKCKKPGHWARECPNTTSSASDSAAGPARLSDVWGSLSGNASGAQ